MSQIGILGGSFDPVHNGHLTIAQAVRKLAPLDAVWLMPTGWSPLKGQTDSASAEHRLAMVKLAIAGHEGLEVCDLELHRPGKSYTFDTLAELSRLHSQHEFSWIIGADNLLTLPRWHRVKELLSRWQVWIAVRPGINLHPAFDQVREKLGAELEHKLRLGVLSTPLVDVSATQLRERIRTGEPVADGLPNGVGKYIFDNELYKK